MSQQLLQSDIDTFTSTLPIFIILFLFVRFKLQSVTKHEFSNNKMNITPLHSNIIIT